ncbi:MAG: hypothetical protein ACKPJO_15265 [Dolichospermum sp.]
MVYKKQDKFYPARFTHMMIYNSQSHAITGIVKAGEIITRTAYQWTEYELRNLCMSRDEIIEFLKSPSAVGVGIVMSKPRLFPNPIPREIMIRDFNINPPQHPKYLNENEVRKISIYATRT